MQSFFKASNFTFKFVSRFSYLIITQSQTHLYFLMGTHYVRFSRLYWLFWANIVMYICPMLQVCIIHTFMVSGPNFEFRKIIATFGTKIPVFRAILGSLLGTKWQKWWITKMSVESWKSYIVGLGVFHNWSFLLTDW